MNKPVIGITMGDAAGIGPEIIVKALADPVMYDACIPLVIGDAAQLERAQRLTGVSVAVHSIATAAESGSQPGVIDCFDLSLLPADLPFAVISAAAGDAAYRYLALAIELAKDGAIDAICTAPLNKEALNLAGHHFPGHTEILAELTGTREYGMMFISPRLIVTLATIHVGLLEALAMLTPDLVYRSVCLTDRTLRRMGIAEPRIAVCGVNPHAGEGGMFGAGEEAQIILPGVQRALAEGMLVSGPYPADTVFFRAVRGDFDAIIAMYHDQGLIAVKTLGMADAVNVTIGLPIIRTSVDHGTAFDIAGKGIADESNLKNAVLLAARLASGEHLIPGREP